ncbi:LysR family transcriptional regulator [Sphaerotilus sp.]|uniref:LysR family transcriptional regulator n=1 Tax=Sphaerotilus sp. TaxID=2093942 RepID=UPI00286D788D|nr:LysR family transcriptional regulator [Sphaerotilus sp.]
MLTDDPPLPDTRLLRLLDLLYDTRSVTRAAERLGLSQPTVSIWLGQLRQQYGDPLFVRTPGGMAPTPRADAMIGPVREALDAMRRLGRAGTDFDPATSTRHFRICMTDASHITLLPPWLAHVRALAPSVSLSAARIDASTADALASGEADLAVGLVPWLEAGFYQQALYPQDWVCLVNGRHPRLGDTLDLAAYEAEAHVGIAAGTGAPLLADALQTQAVQRRVLLELPGFLGLGAILSTTDLVATLPRQIGETLARTSGLRVLDCPVAIEGFTVKQHWHARYHHDAGNRWLRGVCAALFLRPQANPP